MSYVRLLAFNALSMLVANIISKLVLFVGIIFLTQFLDEGLESTYYLVTAFGTVLALNFQDGMVSVTIRRIATDIKNGPHYLGTLYLASIILAIAIGLVTIPLSMLYATSLEGDGVQSVSGLRGQFVLSSCALVAAYLVGYGYSVAGAGFKAYEKLSLEAALMVVQAILSTLVYIYGARHEWHLSNFFFGLLAVNLVHVILSNIVLIVFVVKPRLHFKVKEAWDVFRESLGLGYATLLRTLQDRMHPFFINHFAGHNQITQFSSPNNLLVQLKFIPLSIRPALFPSLARKAQEATDSFQKYAGALMKFLYLVALPLLIMIIISREQILKLVTTMDPEEFREYAQALKIFIFVGWAIALSFPSQVLRSLFVALRKPQYEFRTVLAGVLVLAAMDIILIPRIGVIGAGYAAVACEFVIFMYGLYLLYRVKRGLNPVNIFLLPTLCGIITNSLAEWLYGYHWLAGLGSVIIVFPLLVGAFRIITPDEWRIVREVIKPNSQASQE